MREKVFFHLSIDTGDKCREKVTWATPNLMISIRIQKELKKGGLIMKTGNLNCDTNTSQGVKHFWQANLERTCATAFFYSTGFLKLRQPASHDGHKECCCLTLAQVPDKVARVGFLEDIWPAMKPLVDTGMTKRKAGCWRGTAKLKGQIHFHETMWSPSSFLWG